MRRGFPTDRRTDYNLSFRARRVRGWSGLEILRLKQMLNEAPDWKAVWPTRGGT